MRRIYQQKIAGFSGSILPDMVSWNQLYFRRGQSVLFRLVPPGRDRVSDWKVWNVTKDVFKGASKRAVFGIGDCWKIK